MFTGIIEATGVIARVTKEGSNTHFKVESPLSRELKIDQSVSHAGVCLTVTACDNASHMVTAIEETLSKSNLSSWKAGTIVNLERCMLNNGRFDGHIVQGHVDQTGVVKSIEERNGSWLVNITYDESSGNITVEKGSICVNGVSLTCFNSERNSFTVAIIPYTFNHTDFNKLKVGDEVNLEFDVIGKYVRRLLSGS
jgi:riboflavin synthase